MENVNWGILGCGDVCERKSGPPMYKTPHSALAAVMRRDAAKAADFARRHGVPKSYTDADALIADPGVDIVYVATPPDSHRELALKVLAAGKPVYVEKPMAMNHAECLDMIAAAERSGQRLFVAYYRRALPYFLKVEELLDSGAIGEVLSVEVRYFRPESPGDRDPARLPWRLRREVGGEGYFCDMAPIRSTSSISCSGRSPMPGGARPTAGDSTTWRTPSRRRSASVRACPVRGCGASSLRPPLRRIRWSSRAAKARCGSARSISRRSNW